MSLADVRIVEQLAVALGEAELPQAARQLGAALHKRLLEPVRVALIGGPEGGTSGVRDLLAGGNPVPEMPWLPTLELTYAPRESLVATLSDGRVERRDEIGLAGIAPDDLLFLELATPVPVLERLSILETVAADTGEDLSAALAWAAKRVDMVVWCSQTFTEAEAAVWSRAPDRLRDHAFLATTAPARATPGFAQCHSVAECDGRQALRQAVLDHVALGRREDMDGALFFLERYGLRSKISEHRSPRRAPSNGGDLRPAARVASAAPGPAPEVDASASDLVPSGSAALDQLRALAETLTPEMVPEAFLAQCVDSFDSVAAAAQAPLGSPLDETLAEASDLLILLQLEGDAAASAHAVALLTQVKREIAQHQAL